MVVHNLELTINATGGRQRQYVAMNVHDLHELRLVLDRAIAKDEALREIIASGGMAYIEDIPNEHQRSK